MGIDRRELKTQRANLKTEKLQIQTRNRNETDRRRFVLCFNLNKSNHILFILLFQGTRLYVCEVLNIFFFNQTNFLYFGWATVR